MTAKPEIGPALTLEQLGATVAPTVELGVVRASRPAELVRVATEAAHALASVIEDRKLYSTIQGKRFVRAEGWTTLAAMLGATPHEVSVTEQDGAFTATVELRRLTDGQPIGRASAECGPDEATWKSRPRYARRSMALTRATAKACRLTFSWVMALTNYEVTPAEEIPDEPRRGPPTAKELTEMPVPLRAPEPMPWDGKEPRPAGVTADGEIERGEPAPPEETLFVFRLALKAGITKETFPAYYRIVRERAFDAKSGLTTDDVQVLTAALKAKIAEKKK